MQAKAPVTAGTNSDVEITLNEGESVEAGETLWPMLHYDTGTDSEYEFDGVSGLDLPVIFNGDIVLTSFTVQENQSSVTAMDQTVMNNSITVDVDADTDELWCTALTRLGMDHRYRRLPALRV